MKCKDCKWWVFDKYLHGFVQGHQGRCKKHPLIVIKYEDDFCGEFEEKVKD